MTRKRRILYAILAAYILLGVLYSVVTPIFEASDELWHYPMVKYLADNGLQLPPQNPANPGPWRQEGSQPPLYYMLAAVLTAWIDTSDMHAVRYLNPHPDIGVVRPDGNANMIVHRAALEAFPWRGATLAVQLIRLFSVALGACTVLVTYLLVREVFPEMPVVALGAAALNAFLPMFLFISGSINNDNLSNLLGNLLTLLVVRLLRAKQAPGWRAYVLLGVVTGAGLLAKLNLVFFISLIVLALMLISFRLRSPRPLFVGGLISGALTIAIAGWWYWHNWTLYGDPSGVNRFLDMVGRRAVPANAAQLWSERHSFTQAFWGFFGGVNVPLPEAVYLVFNILGGLGLLSATVYLLYGGWRAIRSRLNRSAPANGEIQWLPAAVTLLWPVVTFVSYLRWTAETPASQGRLVFGALSSICLWMAVGWTWLFPRRLKPVVMSGVAGYFAVVAALTPFLVIAPAYRPPEIIASGQPFATFAGSDGGQIGLVAGGGNQSQILTSVAHPESYVFLQLNGQIVNPTTRDWSLFIHLLSPDDVIIGQRDVYPGGGKLATAELPVNAAWSNPVAVWVPNAAYAPMKLTVEVGWYDHTSGERMKLSDGSEAFNLGTVNLEPRASDLNVPNPIYVNFENQLELVGYSLSTLSPKAGDTVELTLYWRGLRKMERDYKIFANILDPKTLTKYAASDGMPVNWNAPTSSWEPGNIIEDKHTLKVDQNTPPAIYELEIGWYAQEPDGSFPRLRIVTPDGGMADNFMYLSRVRVYPEAGGP
jgi:4-amino-4-deoxy-L-arabinose transferase-like glycosyltransferase